MRENLKEMLTISQDAYRDALTEVVAELNDTLQELKTASIDIVNSEDNFIALNRFYVDYQTLHICYEHIDTCDYDGED